MSSVVEKLFIKLLEGLSHSLKMTTPETPHEKGAIILGKGSHPYHPREIEDIYVAVQELLEHLYIVGGSG